jgi:HlyD family secretion protein
MKKKGLIILAAISILAAGAMSFYFLGDSSPDYAFETVKIEKGSVNLTITATGTLEATNEVEVGCQVSGVIEKLYVDFNSVVKKGQLLAELDKSTLNSTLEAAEADLDEAQAEFEYQEANLARMKALDDKEMLAQSDYDLAVYSYKLSKAGVKSAKASLDKAQRNLSYATIYSPIDGVVLNRAVEEGQTVTASMSTPELYTIVEDLTLMQVEADVDEADIGQVEDGQRVEFTVDAFPDETFEGKVSEVRLEPTEESNVITYTVIVTVANPELKLKPGMTATITDYIKEATNVLVMAGKAVRFEPDREMLNNLMGSMPEGQRPGPPQGAGESEQKQQGSAPGMEQDDSKKMVWVKDGDGIKPIQVEIGINDGSNIEIITGLKEGDLVVTSMEIATKANTKDSDDDEKTSSPFVQEGQKGKGGPPR